MCYLERVGARVYVRGNSFAIKDALKAAGAKWDGDERAWWSGAKKWESLQAVIDQSASQVKRDPADGDKSAVKDEDCQGEDTTVKARVTYKGQSYYVLWSGRTKSGDEKAKLVDRKGERSFWVLRADVTWEKDYGRRNRRSDRIDYPTIGSLAAFAEKMKRADDAAGLTPTKRCWECGGTFTQRDARQNDGDWGDSYCGC